MGDLSSGCGGHDRMCGSFDCCSIIWILLLLSVFCGGNGGGIMGGNCGCNDCCDGGNSCMWLILLLIFCGGGNGFNFGGGCGCGCGCGCDRNWNNNRCGDGCGC